MARMGSALRGFLLVLGATAGFVISGVASPARATLISYEIIFTQTYFHPVFGTVPMVGGFTVDSSLLVPNTIYASSAPLAGLTDFTVSISGAVYQYDFAATALVNTPGFSTLLEIDAAGNVVDIHGVLTLTGTISSVYLGRDTEAGQYLDVRQLGSCCSSANDINRGTYTINRLTPFPTPVPLPAAFPLFIAGFTALGLLSRNRKKPRISPTN